MKREEVEVVVKAKIKTPRVPNFIQQENGRWLPLCAFDAYGLEAIGAAFTVALKARAAEQSKDAEFFYKNAGVAETAE